MTTVVYSGPASFLDRQCGPWRTSPQASALPREHVKKIQLPGPHPGHCDWVGPGDLHFLNALKVILVHD